jgi:hypothetical protein
MSLLMEELSIKERMMILIVGCGGKLGRLHEMFSDIGHA